MTKNANFVDSPRWNVIHSETRALSCVAFIEKVANAADLQSRPDLESLKRCLQDPLIVDCFVHNGWVNARKRRKAGEA